ncbi:MAG: DUF3887 domain-containing protein, partial [Candidatus Cloacimonetes bacterium]|nr:DUF3887 domain-containing protein [Candidatus Cloacimonadota bacterium]
MRTLILIIALGVSCFLFSAETKKIADSYFDHLQKGEFKQCYEMSSPEVQEALTADQLQEAWESLPKQVGKYIGIIEYKKEEVEGYHIHTYALEFEKLVMDMLITIDNNNKVAGLFFTISKTPKPGSDTTLPDYLNADNANERDVTFDCEGMTINAKLTTPKGYENYPLLIMLSGSGPNDMDETVILRKPFRDLALGLANLGIATLRWNKRTHDYPEKMAGYIRITPRNEYMDELEAAMKWMKESSMYNTKYILGHSMGAFMLPQIAFENEDFKGFIMLAGNARPLEDLVSEQYEYIFSLDKMTPEQENELAEIKKQCREIKEINEY